MITQVKQGYDYVGVSIACVNLEGRATDPTSSVANFYKVSQVDGSKSLDTNIGTGGVVTLVKQDSKTGYYGASVEISTLSYGEYEILFEVTIEEIPTIAVDTLSIDISKTHIQYIKDDITGRMDIDPLNNQEIHYGPDNITEQHRFNLYDENGDPSTINVHKRTKV
jgi:hypothetical protein